MKKIVKSLLCGVVLSMGLFDGSVEGMNQQNTQQEKQNQMDSQLQQIIKNDDIDAFVGYTGRCISNYTELLVQACKDSAVQISKNCILNGADVNGSNGDGVTPMMTAVRCANSELICLLENQGAEIEFSTKDNKGASLPYYAYASMNQDVIDWMTDKYEIDFRNLASKLFAAACSHEDSSTLAMLVMEFSSYISLESDCLNDFGHLWVYNIYSDNDQEKFVNLLNYGFNFTNLVSRMFGIACKNCDEKVATRLVGEYGYDIDPYYTSHETDRRNEQAAQLAIEQGSLSLLKLIYIDLDANVSKFLDCGMPPIALAAYFGHSELIKFLMENGAEFTTPNGPHALCIISKQQNSSITTDEILRTWNVEINAADQSGDSPIHYLITSFEDHGFEELLKHSHVDLWKRNLRGETALDILNNAIIQTMEFLLEFLTPNPQMIDKLEIMKERKILLKGQMYNTSTYNRYSPYLENGFPILLRKVFEV